MSNAEKYTATSLRLSEETLDAFRDQAIRKNMSASDVLRQALKLWLIRENLQSPKAMAVVDRSRTVTKDGVVYAAVEYEPVVTGD